jgi:hypothetical protein
MTAVTWGLSQSFAVLIITADTIVLITLNLSFGTQTC